jgi:N6-L-threonylcarbamoyladenine synthase
MPVYILGIESSCDDTSAAVSADDVILSNVTAGQEVHASFGGVVPELASRAHQQNIIPVIHAALEKANILKNKLNAVAYTRGPGLLGSLLVGSSFAKAFASALEIPLLEVDHLKAHVLAHFIRKQENPDPVPSFPFLCLTVSGGHTQIVRVDSHSSMHIIGQTIDDAAGEAFDKTAKILGLPYPGGPVVDKLSANGDPSRFSFAKPAIPGLDFSFSGLKTSILYFIRDRLREDPGFIENNKADICASVQKTILDILFSKLEKAVLETGIREIAIAGGVSANSGLRERLIRQKTEKNWNVYIPPFAYTTDNAAMIAVSGFFKYSEQDFGDQSHAPYARSRF